MLATEAWRALARRMTALVVGVGLAVGTAEVALRVGLPARTRAYVWPPGTQWIIDPDPAVMPGVRGPSRFTINAEGIRGGRTRRVLGRADGGPARRGEAPRLRGGARRRVAIATPAATHARCSREAA